MAEKASRELADVVAASTALSDIDGSAGRLYYRGYDINQLAGVFSVSRMARWTAHVIEQQHADNTLIRPDSEYIGEYERPWIPLDAR